MPNLVEWLVEHEPEFRKSRLPSLYSDLTQLKSSNIDGFVANASTWQTALKTAALAAQLPNEQKIIIRTSEQLLDALRSPQYGEPTGLGLVFDGAVQSGRMLDLVEFNKSEQSIYQKSWLPTPYAIIRWTLRQAGLMNSGSYDHSGRLRQGQLILLDGLEQITKQIMAIQMEKSQNLTDRVMSRDAFASMVAETEVGNLSNSELGALLRFLRRDKSLISYDYNVVKFKASSSDRPEPISQEDSSIASMKATIASIEESVSTLTTKIADLQITAQNAVQSKNKNAALSALRSKKRAEEALQSRTATLDQLETVYVKMQQAVDQVQIMQVMQSSAQALQSLNKQVGGVERVDMIMDNLREEMGQVDEVGQVLEEPLSSKGEIDEVDIDEELAALEKEELDRKEESKSEATKAKLAQLKAAEEALKEKNVQAASKEAEDARLYEELSSSAQRLERLRLDAEKKSVTEGPEPEKGKKEAPLSAT